MADPAVAPSPEPQSPIPLAAESSSPCPWAKYYPPADFGGLGDIDRSRPKESVASVLKTAEQLGTLMAGEKEVITALPTPELQLQACISIAKRNDLAYGQEEILKDAVRFGFMTEQQKADFEKPLVTPSPEARAGILEYYEEKNKAAYSIALEQQSLTALSPPPKQLSSNLQSSNIQIVNELDISSSSGNISGAYRIYSLNNQTLRQLELTVSEPGTYRILGHSHVNRFHSISTNDQAGQFSTTQPNERVTLDAPSGGQFLVLRAGGKAKGIEVEPLLIK